MHFGRASPRLRSKRATAETGEEDGGERWEEAEGEEEAGVVAHDLTVSLDVTAKWSIVPPQRRLLSSSRM
jgi:hypothetical protein